MSIVPNSFYTEGTTAQDLLDRLKESPYLSQGIESQLITYKGHHGFVICETGGDARVYDEKNAQQYATQCEIILLIGRDNSHFLSLYLLTDRRFRPDMLQMMQKYLDKTLIFPVEGMTDFGNSTATLSYTDVGDQSQEFRDALKNLTKYGILSARHTFDGDHPLTWAEYSRLYIWSVYHKRLTDATNPTV